jgi:hypothetical protein
MYRLGCKRLRDYLKIVTVIIVSAALWALLLWPVVQWF